MITLMVWLYQSVTAFIRIGRKVVAINVRRCKLPLFLSSMKALHVIFLLLYEN